MAACCILISTAARTEASCREFWGGMSFGFCLPSANGSFGRVALAQAEEPSVDGQRMAGRSEQAECPLTRCLQLPLVFGVVVLRGFLCSFSELNYIGYMYIFKSLGWVF